MQISYFLDQRYGLGNGVSQNGSSGFQNGSSGFQNGGSGIQNGGLGFQIGGSGYQNGRILNSVNVINGKPRMNDKGSTRGLDELQDDMMRSGIDGMREERSRSEEDRETWLQKQQRKNSIKIYFLVR